MVAVMVEIEASIHVEGNQAASEPATKTTEDNASQPSTGSRFGLENGYTSVSTASAVNFVWICVEGRDSHRATTHIVLMRLLRLRLLDNDDLSLAGGHLHAGLLHRLGWLHHGLLLCLHSHRLAIVSHRRCTDFLHGCIHVVIHSRVVCHINLYYSILLL